MIDSVLTFKSVKTKITVKSLISVGLIALSVILPQLVHLAAGAAGGVKWLPMDLPVLIGGCLLGTWWGLGVGIMSPIISFLITWAAGNPMPALERLPFMVCELATFAAVAGLFSKHIAKNKWLAFPAVLFAQLSGRAVFLTLVAIFQSVSNLSVSLVWAQIQTGLIGLVLQAAIVPLIIIGLQLLLTKDKKNDLFAKSKEHA